MKQEKQPGYKYKNIPVREDLLRRLQDAGKAEGRSGVKQLEQILLKELANGKI